MSTVPVRSLLRSWAWRLGRKLYCWARSDVANNPETNGEYWLLNLALSHSATQPILIDVGANKGDWTLRTLALSQEQARMPLVFSFEPCAQTRAILASRIPSGSNVQISPCALSNNIGEADFFSNGAGSGTNSLDAGSGQAAERVQLTTIDAFLEQENLECVTMVKIDTEGFDLSVMQGASNALSHGRIEIIQFEYNWRWLINKSSLRDVFSLIQGKPYRMGKLSGTCIYMFDEWHFELDRFFETNYVLVLRGSPMERHGCRVKFNTHNVAVCDG